MDLEKPSYYAIIPANVRYDKKLPPNAKLLYGEITCLANKNGYCYASNSFFAELYDVDKATISRWIAQLKDSGYISIVMVKNKDTQNVERQIRIGADIPPIDEKINTPLQKNQYPIDENVNTPIDENAMENNTSNNNTRLINYGAPAPTPAPEKKSKKPPLSEREPQNDLEWVEKTYLENYTNLYKKKILKTPKPCLNWGQCRKLERDRINDYGVDAILTAINQAMQDDFCVQHGYTLSLILSAGMLNSLLNGNDWKRNRRAIDEVDAVTDEALANVPF